MTIEHQASTRTLADDLLNGVGAIASYTGESERRVRHLIDRHSFPVIRHGQRIYSRKSWCEEYYSLNGGGSK
jgi:hypothetical protein